MAFAQSGIAYVTQPSVSGAARAPVVADHDLVDVGSAVAARVVAGDDGEAGAQRAGALGEAIAVAEAGEGDLDRVDQPVEQVGRRHRRRVGECRGRRSSSPRAASTSMQRKLPALWGTSRRQAVEDADHRAGHRAGLGEVEPERPAVDVVAQVDLDLALVRVDVDRDVDRHLLVGRRAAGRGCSTPAAGRRAARAIAVASCAARE